MKFFVLMVMLATTPGPISFPQSKNPRPELASLVETERSFSRACLAKGLRVSFMEFFAEDGIRFLPHPVKAQENFRQRPAPPGPEGFTLSWEPVFADISQAGDLGFTTGPYVISDKTKKNPPGYGYYFSIWRKQNDGSWKVLLDYGTDTPTPANPDSPTRFSWPISKGWKHNVAKPGMDDSTILAKLDRETSALSSSQGITAAYRHYLSGEARLHRAGLVPLVDLSSILGFLEKQRGTNVSFEPIASGMAQSADLGYSYGKYSLRRKDSPAVIEAGYYARIWKRDEKGNWKIAMDVANALPPEPPPKS